MRIEWCDTEDILLIRKTARLLYRLHLLVQVMILVRRSEVRLVADVHDCGDAGSLRSQVLLGSAWLENVVKSGLESFRPSHEFDESLHVVRYGKGILCAIISDSTGSMSFARAAISISIEQLPQHLETKMMMAPVEIG